MKTIHCANEILGDIFILNIFNDIFIMQNKRNLRQIIWRDNNSNIERCRADRALSRKSYIWLHPQSEDNRAMRDTSDAWWCLLGYGIPPYISAQATLEAAATAPVAITSCTAPNLHINQS